MKIYALTPDSEEQLAVVSARTSRSPNTFDIIQEEVRAKGHVQFIKDNVLGYGHDSVAEVAQCPAIAIEDISDLAANVIALADPQLVVQMTSTRFQDMAKRRIVDQSNGATGELMKQRYMVGMVEIQKILDATNHPRKRTLQCDIARGHLPAGVSTQLSIRGNARIMRDVVSFCLGHEMPEVRSAGEQIHAAVKEHIEVLFDRHITPAPSPLRRMSDLADVSRYKMGFAQFSDDDVTQNQVDERAIAELTAWRESGWRRRFRMAAAPSGPHWSALISTDYGAYRDLRRNRTITQSDLLPYAYYVPDDALWAFRELYPDVCDAIDGLFIENVWNVDYDDNESEDPYHAPMGAIMNWSAGGHIFNWAYMMRSRSWVEAGNPKAGCHPAYALPMRSLMKQILEMPNKKLAEAMGIVSSPKSLSGVEFSDRVPA